MSDTQPQFIDRRASHECKHESTISGLTHDRDAMKNTLEGVSTKLDLILAQITKVAILEERHTNSTLDINRAHAYIADLREDVDTLSKEVREFINYSKGAARTAWAVWSFMGATVLAVLGKVLFGVHS